MVFCAVSSWITGTRAVSLPFSDHCDPLVDDAEEIHPFLQELAERAGREPWDYLEFRPRAWDAKAQGVEATSSYWLHVLDLTLPLEHLLRNMHRDSIQRKVRRAEREGVTYERGRTSELADEFYGLVVRTRRRHRLVPQPRAWFDNVIELCPEAEIRVARRNQKAIAALLTLRHGASVVYKYGGSDERAHALGAVPFLFWRLIEESKAYGAQELDFGRSDEDQSGLLAFKDHFGARRQPLKYFRYSRRKRHGLTGWTRLPMGSLVSVLPKPVLSAAGRLIYRHIG